MKTYESPIKNFSGDIITHLEWEVLTAECVKCISEVHPDRDWEKVAKQVSAIWAKTGRLNPRLLNNAIVDNNYKYMLQDVPESEDDAASRQFRVDIAYLEFLYGNSPLLEFEPHAVEMTMTTKYGYRNLIQDDIGEYIKTNAVFGPFDTKEEALLGILNSHYDLNVEEDSAEYKEKLVEYADVLLGDQIFTKSYDMGMVIERIDFVKLEDGGWKYLENV